MVVHLEPDIFKGKKVKDRVDHLEPDIFKGKG